MAELLPNDANSLKRVFSAFPTGVAVICARTPDGEDGGMTANAVCSLSLDPMLVLVCFERQARTLGLVERAGRFSINILGEDAAALAERFASKLSESDKMGPIAASDHDGVPVLDDAIAFAVCSVRETFPGGDHLIVTAEVDALSATEAAPLVWHRGAWGSVHAG
jgi:flavin reductase (DIM6/NTAB) family NADH-FMN oxidoreductase RutF